jgi:hypothetical protein
LGRRSAWYAQQKPRSRLATSDILKETLSHCFRVQGDHLITSDNERREERGREGEREGGREGERGKFYEVVFEKNPVSLY